MLDRTGAADVQTIGKSVSLRNIVKRYGTFHAVRNVSFDLHPGELLTLLGPSGSGKTTTLMMVAGFDEPDEGSIGVDGRNVVGLTAQERNFGVVFQGYALFPHMTALENVEFPLRMRNVPRDQRRRMAQEMLERVGLGTMMQRRPRELSGGQQQRVALARALVFKPDALLLDEPLGALDKNMREKMQYEIKELQRTLGISIMFVTHDQEEAMSMSDRIAVMNDGQVVQIGTPQSVYKQPRTAFVAGFLGETNLLSCTIGAKDAGGASIRLEDGQGGRGTFTADAAGISAGDGAKLSVRPEKIVLLRAGEQANFRLAGTVREHTFIGRHSRTVVTVGGTDFAIVTADATRTEHIRMGSPADIGWAYEDAQILPS